MSKIVSGKGVARRLSSAIVCHSRAARNTLKSSACAEKSTISSYNVFAAAQNAKNGYNDIVGSMPSRRVNEAGMSGEVVKLQDIAKERWRTPMDINELMLKHIETIAEDIGRSNAEFKGEFREREERITQNQAKLEERIDQKLDKFYEDFREREGRLDDKVGGLNLKIDELNTKFDTKFDHLREEVSKESRNVILSVVALTITVVLGIAGLIISVLQLVPKG